MDIFTHTLTEVTPIQRVTATSTYGIGLLTAIVLWFCNIFGCECDMYNVKVEKAEKTATQLLENYAYSLGATGIMDVSYQVHGTTVFVSGTAYTKEQDN